MRFIPLALPLLIFLAACGTEGTLFERTLAPEHAVTVTMAAVTTEDDSIAVPTIPPATSATLAKPSATPLPVTSPPPIPVTTSTGQPTSQPPLVRPTPAQPVILSFTASPLEVNPGEDIILDWSSSGGSKAVIQQYLLAVLGPFLDVPLNGSLVLKIGDHERHWHQLVLVVSNDAGGSTQGSLTVRIRCPHTYFFTPSPSMEGWDSCPAEPATFSWAAEQVFEGGRMIWFQADNVIYVFDDDRGRDGPPMQQFVDTWTPDEPESDPSIIPPQGLYQPIRGFGKVWRNEPGVREQLGWVLAPEQGFDGAYQRGWAPYYGWLTAYLRTADGRVIGIYRDGGWEFVNP